MKKAMTDAEYFKHPAISNTKLGQILKSMNHYLNKVDEESSAFDFGKAFHLLILEPDKFEQEVILSPYPEFRTNESKDWRKANSHKIILKEKDFDTLYKMKASLMAHPKAKIIMGKGEAESCYFANYKGREVKAKVDWISEGIVFDLKTTLDASPDEFMKSIGNFGYYRQAQHYLNVVNANGIKADKFVFIVVEKEAPFNVGVYMISQEALEIGQLEIDFALKRLHEYENTSEDKKVLGYSNEIELIGCPNWVNYKYI